nr:MAG TPA: cysteine-rich protein [Caudoviricetes sp.]
MQASLPVSVAAERAPIPCPHCGRPLPVWAEPHAAAVGVWVKCKNPACKREIEIKL